MRIKQGCICLLLLFITGWIIFTALQNDFIYGNSLGLFSDNWENSNGERKLVDKSFDEIDNTNYIRWDAVHYHLIKEYGYDVEKAGGEYIFAFFPLFPYIWKISNLPPLGILFLNYLFFSVSLLILSNLFSTTKNYLNTLFIVFTLPSLIIFLIPYTEATFLLMASIGIYGFMKKNYTIFFIGFVLASLTRSSYIFLVVSFIFTECFFFLNHKKIVLLLKNILLRIAPLLVGTAIASGIQLLSGSKSITKFIEVQKYWEHVFAIPHFLKDWSHESFSINIGVIILVSVPLFGILAQKIYFQLRKKYANAINHLPNEHSYLVMLSLVYILLLTLFVIFFQSGGLHNLYRYTIATPFFFVLIFCAHPFIEQVPKTFRFFIFFILSVISIFILGLADYSTYWNFSDVGLFILICSLFFWLFQEYAPSPIYKVGLYLSIFLNVVWTCYLLNTYIADGWIFAKVN